MLRFDLLFLEMRKRMERNMRRMRNRMNNMMGQMKQIEADKKCPVCGSDLEVLESKHEEVEGKVVVHNKYNCANCNKTFEFMSEKVEKQLSVKDEKLIGDNLEEVFEETKKEVVEKVKEVSEDLKEKAIEAKGKAAKAVEDPKQSKDVSENIKEDIADIKEEIEELNEEPLKK